MITLSRTMRYYSAYLLNGNALVGYTSCPIDGEKYLGEGVSYGDAINDSSALHEHGKAVLITNEQARREYRNYGEVEYKSFNFGNGYLVDKLCGREVECKINSIEDAAYFQRQVILNLLGLCDGEYSIEIKDSLTALCFKKYGNYTACEDGKFEVTFEDAENVVVSLEDFIDFHLYYSTNAVAISDEFADDIDGLRDLQKYIKEEM